MVRRCIHAARRQRHRRSRGFPLEPRPGERVDHPHPQRGSWLNYGSVNGVDFWNNSTVVRGQPQAGGHGHRAASPNRQSHRRATKANSKSKPIGSCPMAIRSFTRRPRFTFRRHASRAHGRSHLHAHRAGQTRLVNRRQGRHAGPARAEGTGAAVEGFGRAHGRQRQTDHAKVCRYAHGRQRTISR